MMNPRKHRCAALAACCLMLLAACGDRHKPTKPTAAAPGAHALVRAP